MTARSEALILLSQAQRLPIGSAGRTDLLAQAQTLAILAITEPQPKVEPTEEPTPKEVVAVAVKARRKTTKETNAEDKPGG